MFECFASSLGNASLVLFWPTVLCRNKIKQFSSRIEWTSPCPFALNSAHWNVLITSQMCRAWMLFFSGGRRAFRLETFGKLSKRFNVLNSRQMGIDSFSFTQYLRISLPCDSWLLLNSRRSQPFVYLTVWERYIFLSIFQIIAEILRLISSETISANHCSVCFSPFAR